jgi:peptide/nickel transport system substrate-binding protein
MQLRIGRRRAAFPVAAFLVIGALLLPAGGPIRAADKVILRVGTVQDLDSLNPFQTELVVGYESFQLTYHLMVDFGPNLEPVPGFADTWERAADGKSWTFHIRDGMTWSDGQPATAQDACFSWQLALDAIKNDTNLGVGYLDPGLKDAAVSKLECPDDHTVVATTNDASQRILQTYLPILPKHIWGKETYKTIGDAKFEAPLVGSGPYTVAEWNTGQYVRFVRNPRYVGTQGYEDEIVIQFFKSEDTMVQALKAGEIDYARDPNPDQLKALQATAGTQTVVGAANGWTQLAFNTYGTGTGKTIKGGGPSTQALLDPAFRDALGYAVDKKMLVDRVLGGFGDVGTTIVPPVLNQFHVEPTTPRTFNIDLAKQKLDAAGYVLDAQGQRLDKQGKPISLRLFMPNTNASYPKTAQFIRDWYAQLGVKVTTQVLDQATLGELVLPPEAGAKYKADYDIELWGWSGNVDPNALLQIFKCDAIGGSSDSQYCNPEFDKLYDQQTNAPSMDQRNQILAQMQNMIYDQAVYDILYYDANLAAYHTDRFAGWENEPLANGTPLFTYSTLGYTKLTNAAAVVTPPPTVAPTPVESSPAATPGGASAAPTTVAPATAAPTPVATTAPGSSSGSDSGGLPLPLLLGGGAVVVIVVAVVLFGRRGKGGAEEEE